MHSNKLEINTMALAPKQIKITPTTEIRDKLEKLSAYSRIPSLIEYFTLAQDKVEIHRYSKSGNSVVLTAYQDGDIVEVDSIGLSLPVKTIYMDVAGQLFNG